jgi:pyruvyl transferase EpsO
MREGTLGQQLQHAILDVLRPLIAGRRVALLDFPRYANVGDSAIWIGELHVLEQLDVSLSHTCDLLTYDPGLLERHIGDGVIVLSGGGSLGDLWERYQPWREQVIDSFPRNRIVQLPQSIHYQNQAAVDRAKRVFENHADFTLLVRDQQSLGFAARVFAVPTLLCPDMAFGLGALDTASKRSEKILWIVRRDREAAAEIPDSVPGRTLDWARESPSGLAMLNGRLSHRFARSPWLRSPLRRPLSATYGPLARQRLRRGLSAVRRAQVVVTDRLHGHVLCLLTGTPHVLLDNSYGKIRSFYDTWTREANLVRWAGTADEAIAVAADWPEPGTAS